MNRRRAVVTAIAVACWMLGTSTQASAQSGIEIFVAPDGDDAQRGTREAPVATLARARDLARKDLRGDAIIHVGGGLYRLEETLLFDHRDQRADDGAALKVMAATREPAVLSGAAPIVGEWRPLPGREDLWEIAIPESFGEVRTVFREGAMLPRARTRGFRQLKIKPADVPYRQRREIDGRHLYLPREAISAVADFAGAEMRVIPRFPWIMNLQPMSSVDRETGLVSSKVPSIYPLTTPVFGRFSEGTMWVENVIEAIDEVGEWIFDARRRMLVLKSDGQPEGIEVAHLTELIRIEGEEDPWDYADRPLRGIEFRGITFCRAKRYAWPADKTGWGLQHDWEMYDRPTAMVRLRFAEDCHFVDCHFVDSGAAGLRMDLHAQRNEVRHCEFTRLGGLGVLLAGYGMGWKDVNRENLVADCSFHDLGREWWGSPAVFVWQSGENRIVHNEIYDLPYSGIVVSGRTQMNVSGLKEASRTARWEEVINHLEGSDRSWRAREPLMHGRHNEIGWNDISDVMKILSDGNAIYVSGTGGGNRVHSNFIHDIESPNINASIRTDDDQYEVIIEDNVIAHCSGEGIVLKGINTLRHNLVYDLRPRNPAGVASLFQRGYLVLSGAAVTDAPIEGNAFVSLSAGQVPLFERREPWVKGGRTMAPVTLASAASDRNLWWCSADPSWGESFIAAQRELGAESKSVGVYPALVAPEKLDFRVSDEAAPAVRALIGDGWDVSSAGPR